MRSMVILVGLAAAIMFGASPSVAQITSDQLHNYFAGKAIQFGFGTGSSTGRPRIDTITHYCASGTYFSSGQSCRPNPRARGYQCTPVEDFGRWQIGATGGQAALQWMSNTGIPSQIPLHIHSNGVVADAEGNPFSRVGRAECP